MIKDRQNILIHSFMSFYIERILRKNFSRFVLVNELPEVPDEQGLLVTPNHFSWWDGFFVWFLFKKLSERKIRLMMLEEHLKKYIILSYMGAFSINPGSLKGNRDSIEYSASVISDSSKFLVVYPQGEIQQSHEKNLLVKDGLRLILKTSGKECIVLPVAFKTEYGSSKYPVLYCRVGNPISSNEVIRNPELFRNAFIDNIKALYECPYPDGKDLFGRS